MCENVHGGVGVCVSIYVFKTLSLAINKEAEWKTDEILLPPACVVHTNHIKLMQM